MIVPLIMLNTLRVAADNLDEHLKKDPVKRLMAMRELKELHRADRIPYAELARAVMASFSSAPLVTPLSEADRLEAELLADVRKP